MTKRTFTDRNGNSWEWDETPETIDALKQLHETANQVNEVKFVGNYPGPLYAPHPDIEKNGKETN